MVGEFPELQGVMGRYYALDQQENPTVADAIAAHYKPVGPSDDVPREPVAIAVALADKLDMLVGFWAIDEKPTGSKDPYALRRAALGVIRIVLENGVRLNLWLLLRNLALKWRRHLLDTNSADTFEALLAMPHYIQDTPEFDALLDRAVFEDAVRGIAENVFFSAVKDADNLLAFFADRLKVHLRDQGARHDLVDAVFALGGDDLLDDRAPRRGARALPRYRGRRQPADRHQARHQHPPHRGEEGHASYDQPPDPKLFKRPEEKALAKAVDEVEKAAAAAVAREDFEAAMSEMAKLQEAGR